MKQVLIWVLAIVAILATMGLFDDLFGPKKPEKPAEPANLPLDYSKPIYTTSITIVCPTSLLFDMRADHAPDKVMAMFFSLWDRSSKAKELGCEELQEGIPVTATAFMEHFAHVGLPGGAGGGSLFTTEDELTNKVPGQSDATKADLAISHINKAPDGPVPTSDEAGRLLVTIPSPISGPTLTGNVMAASDSQGDGAIICPDADIMAAAMSMNALHKGDSIEEWLKPYGCSYLPPGTPMVSEGRNATGALAIVNAELSDGTKINGVTFPNMIVQDQKETKP